MAPKKRKLDGEGNGGIAKKARAITAPRSMRITRNMTTDGPRQAVFNTAELLEAVLLKLPMKQLFPIRRVSKQFCDCINTSVKLQEKMFLRPRNVEKEAWTLRMLKARQDEVWIYNQDCEFVPSSDSVTNRIKNAENLQPTSINPVIGDKIYGDTMAAQRWLHSLTEMVTLGDLKNWLMHPGTWKDMHFTDPPCTKASVSLDVELNTAPSVKIFSEKDVELCNPNGLTFGGLATALMEEPHELWIYRDGLGDKLRTSSISAVMSEVRETKKKKGHLIKEIVSQLRLTGVVLATAEDWEEVRRKTAAARSVAA